MQYNDLLDILTEQFSCEQQDLTPETDQIGRAHV